MLMLLFGLYFRDMDRCCHYLHATITVMLHLTNVYVLAVNACHNHHSIMLDQYVYALGKKSASMKVMESVEWFDIIQHLWPSVPGVPVCVKPFSHQLWSQDIGCGTKRWTCPTHRYMTVCRVSIALSRHLSTMLSWPAWTSLDWNQYMYIVQVTGRRDMDLRCCRYLLYARITVVLHLTNACMYLQ